MPSKVTKYFGQRAASMKKMAAENAMLTENQKAFRWELTIPKAPHRRGCVESLVKLVKRGIQAMNTVQEPGFADDFAGYLEQTLVSLASVVRG